MTLTVNEISYNPTEPDRSRILCAADQQISRGGERLTLKQKLFKIANLNAAFSYFGLAAVSDADPVEEKDYFSSILPDKASSNVRSSIIDFAYDLRYYLNANVPKRLLQKNGSGLHVCGFEGHEPQMWFIRNIGGIAGDFSYERFNDGKGKTWYLRYDEPSANGKRNQRNLRIGRMSKSSAEVRKREILRQLDEGGTQDRVASASVAQFLNQWLEVRRPNLAATTFIRYKQMVDRDVLPVIGTVRLSKVETGHIERVYAAALERGLSKRSCLHIHRMLHKAFKDAVRKKGLAKNVVHLVEAPRPEERETAPISRDRVRLLIEAAQGSRLEVPVAVSAVTGLRRGEVLALRWRNIDLERGTLFVAESLEHTREFGVRFKSPKSRSSKRSIPLSPECVEILARHKKAQDQVRANAEPYYDDQDLVFPNPDGSPWPPDTFSVQFGKLAALVGLKGFRFHDMRHAFASMTLADGVSVKEVQTLMGHSSPTVTLSVYARSMEGLGRAAVNGLSRSLFDRLKQVVRYQMLPNGAL